HKGFSFADCPRFQYRTDLEQEPSSTSSSRRASSSCLRTRRAVRRARIHSVILMWGGVTKKPSNRLPPRNSFVISSRVLWNSITLTEKGRGLEKTSKTLRIPFV